MSELPRQSYTPLVDELVQQGATSKGAAVTAAFACCASYPAPSSAAAGLRKLREEGHVHSWKVGRETYWWAVLDA